MKTTESSKLTFSDVLIMEFQQRMALVEWINSALPDFYLSVLASDEELRASLLDGDIFYEILKMLKCSTSGDDKGYDSSPSTGSRRRKVQRFIAVISEMGLPSFEITDLEKGSMRPVLDCLLALKEHTNRHFGTPYYRTLDDRRQALSELKVQPSYSPLSPESPSMLLHGGYKFQEVFQTKQRFYADLPATKISAMIKSDSFDNAPTQSLLSVINGILDENIDKKDAEIPQGIVSVIPNFQRRSNISVISLFLPCFSQNVACLLRKVVQEIERRIATQGEHLRTQSNHFKAREKKYQSRIKVLEALAKGTSEESEIVMNQLQHMKYELSKMEEKQRSQQQEEEKMSEQKQMEKRRFEQQEIEVKKRLEQMMEEKKRFEEKEANKFKKLREETDIEVSGLKQELELAKRTHELLLQELKTEVKQLKSELEKKLSQQEQLLEDSEVKMKELELNSQSESQKWTKKERIYKKLMDLQLSGLEKLRHSSVSIKQEVLKTQNIYLHELDHVGAKLKNLAEAAQNYHGVMNENQKLSIELDAARNKEERDVKEFMGQVASLKRTLAKKDEEIERLLTDPRSPSISSMHSLRSGSCSPNNNPLKSNRSSPSARSITSSPRKIPTVSTARHPGIHHKSFDSFLDHSDPGSQLAFGDSESEGSRPPWSMSDLKGQNKRAGGTSMDDNMMALLNDDRFSETSGGDFSVGTDQTDATFESNFLLERSKSTNSAEKHREKQKKSKRLSQPPKAPTGASRMSRVKATLRATLGLKKHGSRSSSLPVAADGGSKSS
ncbi:kinesin-like protein KIN-14C isoform X2 [Silene latifolia]|uniref:kinesin-like protein KIN-14C isoform X2 n=1 Tax=Silene latifolia TaxID=37657 RepID=UPI003D77D8C9